MQVEPPKPNGAHSAPSEHESPGVIIFVAAIGVGDHGGDGDGDGYSDGAGSKSSVAELPVLLPSMSLLLLSPRSRWIEGQWGLCAR